MDELLNKTGLEGLAFALLHELAHHVKKHIRHNIRDSYRYGDIRRQLFFFNNQFTGFDALFLDYYTNTRFTLD